MGSLGASRRAARITAQLCSDKPIVAQCSASRSSTLNMYTNSEEKSNLERSHEAITRSCLGPDEKRFVLIVAPWVFCWQIVVGHGRSLCTM